MRLFKSRIRNENIPQVARRGAFWFRFLWLLNIFDGGATEWIFALMH